MFGGTDFVVFGVFCLLAVLFGVSLVCDVRAWWRRRRESLGAPARGFEVLPPGSTSGTSAESVDTRAGAPRERASPGVRHA